tara:strand:+ start:389 stop:652 length:264 start_codon:yes stop_codon:yes gene_type:complete
MSKHEIKLLENDINDLRNQVFYLNGLLNKITEWLEQELAEGQEVINEYEGDLRPKCSDGTDDIIEGRSECATSLLEQIKNWENEDDR